MWPDTLFISPVPNIRFLFFKVAYYHHYRPSSYYHSFFQLEQLLFSSLFVDIGKEGFFSIGQRLSRDAAAKKLELIFRTLVLVSGNFAFQFRNISFALRYFPLGPKHLIWLKTTVLETWMWTKKYSNLGHTNAILKVFLSAFILTFLRDLNVHAKNKKKTVCMLHSRSMQNSLAEAALLSSILGLF